MAPGRPPGPRRPATDRRGAGIRSGRPERNRDHRMTTSRSARVPRALAALALRFPWTLVTAAALAAIVSLWLAATRLEFQFGHTDLISAGDRYRQLDARDRLEFEDVPERVVVAIRADDPEQAKGFAAALAGALGARSQDRARAVPDRSRAAEGPGTVVPHARRPGHAPPSSSPPTRIGSSPWRAPARSRTCSGASTTRSRRRWSAGSSPGSWRTTSPTRRRPTSRWCSPSCAS